MANIDNSVKFTRFNTKFLFFLSVITIPFTDFLGLRFLGEMQHDLSGHLMTITLVCVIFSSYSHWFNYERYKTGNNFYRINEQEIFLTTILIIFLCIIFISLAVNYNTIINTYRFERYGIGKFAASTIMVIYGFSFAFLAMSMVKKHSYYDLIIKPIGISIVVCAIFAMFEGLSAEYKGVFKTLQLFISELTHLGSRGQNGVYSESGGEFGWYDDTPGKTRSVSFEAPAFADYLGMSWPWLYAGYIISSRKKKLYYGFLCLLCLILMYFSGARTGYVFIVVSIITTFLLHFVYLTKRESNLRPFITFLLWLCFMATLASIPQYYTNTIDSSIKNLSYFDPHSVSSLTRLSMMTAGWNMFTDDPLFGIGYGQYGFFVKQNLANWSWDSWEIENWFSDSPSVWPSAFSSYIRIIAELGVVGLLFWCGLWYYLARTVLKVTIQYKRISGTINPMAYPLIMSCYAVLIHGFASDAMHSPIIWIDLGLCCLYISETKKLVAMERKVTKEKERERILALKAKIRGIA